MGLVLFYFGKDLLGVLTTEALEEWCILRVTGMLVGLSCPCCQQSRLLTAVVCLMLPPSLVLGQSMYQQLPPILLHPQFA